MIEMYSYTAAGAVTKKRMRMVRSGGATAVKDVTYAYGADGKLSIRMSVTPEARHPAIPVRGMTDDEKAWTGRTRLRRVDVQRAG